VPSDERRRQRIAEGQRVLLEVEMTPLRQRCVEWRRKRQRGKRVEADVNLLPADRDDGAEAQISAEHLLRRDPDEGRRFQGDRALDLDVDL
jgi:hypothetical protein